MTAPMAASTDVSVDLSLQDIARELDGFLRPEQDQRQARKRERILAAATERFIAHGYRKTSVEDVARAAGVAKGTVYLYYRSKPELLFHAIAREKRDYLERLAPLWNPGLGPRDRLRGFIALGVIMNRDMPLVTRLTGGDHEIALAMQEVDDSVLEGINQLQIAMTSRLIDDATGHRWSPAELERRAKILIDVVFAVMTSGPMVQRGLPLEQYATLLAEVLVDGVAHPAGPGAPEPFDQTLLSAAGRSGVG